MLTKKNYILSAVQVSEISKVIGFKDARVQCTLLEQKPCMSMEMVNHT